MRRCFLNLLVGLSALAPGICAAGVLRINGYLLMDLSRVLHSDEFLEPTGVALSIFLDLFVRMFFLLSFFGDRD